MKNGRLFEDALAVAHNLTLMHNCFSGKYTRIRPGRNLFIVISSSTTFTFHFPCSKFKNSGP